MQQTEGGLTII